MGKIKILHDDDGEYGYPVGLALSVDELLEDFHNSDDCDEKLWEYLCRIPIPYAVYEIARIWGFDYVFL